MKCTLPTYPYGPWICAHIPCLYSVGFYPCVLDSPYNVQDFCLYASQGFDPCCMPFFPCYIVLLLNCVLFYLVFSSDPSLHLFPVVLLLCYPLHLPSATWRTVLPHQTTLPHLVCDELPLLAVVVAKRVLAGGLEQLLVETVHSVSSQVFAGLEPVSEGIVKKTIPTW